MHYQNYQSSLQHPPPPQFFDDLPDLVLYTTFNAIEILDLLKIVLDKNLNSKSTKDRILSEIINELIKTSWNDKLSRFLDSIRIRTQTAIQTQSNQIDLSPFNELYDIIAYLQILGGLDPTSAAEAGIKHDFIASFKFMMKMLIRLSNDKWPECPPNSQIYRMLNHEKQKMFILCFKTVIELLNKNLPYFDSSEALIRCFIDFHNSIAYFDQSSTFSPPLRRLYDRLQIELFKISLNAYQLPAVIKSALRLKIDITDAIELLPNNARKFLVVSQVFPKIDPDDPLSKKYRNCLIHCVQKSNDVDVIVQGMKTFPKDPECKNHFFNKLSELLSIWINAFLSERNPFNSETVKLAYKPLKKIMHILSENDKHKLFSKVKETELVQALAAYVKREVKELNPDDPMAQDIKAIISE